MPYFYSMVPLSKKTVHAHTAQVRLMPCFYSVVPLS